MKRPNVLLITCDQLRRDALGIYGNDVVRTPTIDRVFQNGFRFTNMFAANPVCAPNRGAIATGRWPRVNGLARNGSILPESEITMMEVFRQYGYRTYGVGKMHFAPQREEKYDSETGDGAVDPQPPPHRLPHYGFERCVLTEDNRGGPYAEYLKRHGYHPWAGIDNWSPGCQHCCEVSPFPEEHHQTTWITEHSLDFLRHHDRNRPFFMWVSYVHPHHPFTPPAPYDEMYDPARMPLPVYREGEHRARGQNYQDRFRGRVHSHENADFSAFPAERWQRIKAFYYGMISQIDANVERLVRCLKESNQFDNTIIVFTSDHGELLGDHHLMFKSFPFDCVTAVPFLVRIPEGPNELHSVDTLCRSLEIMPTLLELAELPVPEHVNGRSLKRHIEAEPAELFDSILIEHNSHQTVRTRTYRLTVHHDDPIGELYDLRRDPDNLENVWAHPQYAGVRDALLCRLVRHLYEVMDPRFRPVAPC